MDNTYWLIWEKHSKGFSLVDWEKNYYGTSASFLFWPYITDQEAQNTVLLECHETNQIVERNIESQILPNLPLAKLGFVNKHIKAMPMTDEFYDGCIKCIYTVKE